jgi:hypothetical protein
MERPLIGSRATDPALFYKYCNIFFPYLFGKEEIPKDFPSRTRTSRSFRKQSKNATQLSDIADRDICVREGDRDVVELCTPTT